MSIDVVSTVVKVDMSDGCKESITFVQGDKMTRELVVELTDNRKGHLAPYIITGSTIKAKIKTPTNKDITVSGVIESDVNGVVSFVDSSYVAESGRHQVQLIVTSGTLEIKTPVFHYDVSVSL